MKLFILASIYFGILLSQSTASSHLNRGAKAVSHFFQLFSLVAPEGVVDPWDSAGTLVTHSNASPNVGVLERAKRPADVRPAVGSLNGDAFYSGYVTATNDGMGQMFYWYFPPRRMPQSQAPLLLWLSGGPGCSSSFAALMENGPSFLQSNISLSRNDYAWTEAGGVVYVDQPLGTGFSEPGKPGNYAVNEKVVASDLRTFLENFVKLFPEVKNRPFYVTGESYAGHYIPALGDRLLTHPVPELPLAGLAIGNGWIDPAVQYELYPEYAYENKMITTAEYVKAREAFKVCSILARSPMWPIALVQCNIQTSSLIGTRNPYDIRLDCTNEPMCYDLSYLDTYMNSLDTKQSLNVDVNHQWHDCDRVVYALMSKDWFSRLSHKLGNVLQSGIKVLMYHGDQDFICNWKGGYAVANSIPWDKTNQFSRAPLVPWAWDGKRFGEWKYVDNFAFIKIANAGHMVPMDQPSVALRMIQQFVANPKSSRWANSFGSTNESTPTTTVRSVSASASYVPRILYKLLSSKPETFVFDHHTKSTVEMVYK